MTERVKCKNAGCKGLILISTAEKTGGFCMPCVQKKKRMEREIYIKENKKDIDPYKGITDRVEIIKIMHKKRKYDPLIKYLPYSRSIEELYHKLSEHEDARLVAFAIDEAELGCTDYIESICLMLAAFRNADLSNLHRFMLNQHLYNPGYIFKGASEGIVNTLLNRLSDDPENRNLALLGLAWTGNSLVVKKFSNWKSTPPIWAKELYIRPESYSKDAGWIVDDQKQKKNLYFDKCYSLLPIKDRQKMSCLSICTISKNSCKWCNRELTNLFEIDLENSLFDFLNISGEKLRIATCDVCSSYSDALFMEFSTQGDVQWSSFNSKPDYLPDDSDSWDRIPENCLVMSDETRAVDYAANEFLPTTFSQIGGMPTWIQDFAYPDCPSCKKTMIFIAQISNEDIFEYGEGIYYSYICSECNITATNYQQT